MTMLEPIQEKTEAYSVCWVRQVILYTHRHVVHVNSRHGVEVAAVEHGVEAAVEKQQLLGLYYLY